MLGAWTRLLNRSGLNKLRELAMASNWHQGRIFSVAVIDLDHFKRINDTCGHAVGDQVLQVVAEEIRRAIRGGDYAGRFGGEEFVVIMPDTPTAGARTVMERLRKGPPISTASQPAMVVPRASVPSWQEAAMAALAGQPAPWLPRPRPGFIR